MVFKAVDMFLPLLLAVVAKDQAAVAKVLAVEVLQLVAVVAGLAMLLIPELLQFRIKIRLMRLLRLMVM